MDKLAEIRIKELDVLKEFITVTKNRALLTLQTLGWEHEKIKQKQVLSKTQCPFDDSHFVKPDNFHNHYLQCELQHHGYSKDDKFLPKTCNLESPLTSIILSPDNNIKGVQAFPQTLDRIISSATREERLKLYDFAVTNTKPHHEISKEPFKTEKLFDETNRTKSVLEEQAQNRDVKRRRIKYKVSTKSKTYTEVMREVIENQMAEINEEYINKQKLHEDTKRIKDHTNYKQKEQNLSKYYPKNQEYNKHGEVEGVVENASKRKFDKEKTRNHYDRAEKSKYTDYKEDTSYKESHKKEKLNDHKKRIDYDKISSHSKRNTVDYKSESKGSYKNKSDKDKYYKKYDQ